MSLTEVSLNIPAEHIANIFGQFDAHIRKIERALKVTLVVRGESVKLLGDERGVKNASGVFSQLLELAKRGNMITEQNVDYALALVAEEKESALSVIDSDCICHTVNGKPVKPKTIGQKAYVDAIRKNMLVFGIGPAGTGKTYLAMAMAITAFKNEEVGRIILTRPAIEAGEKLGFLPGDLQSKVDPYLRPLYDALHQIMGAESFQRNMEKGLIEVAPLAYMGAHARQCFYYTGRGAEYDAGTDENVSDQNRFWVQGGRHRGRHTEGSGARGIIRAGCGA